MTEMQTADVALADVGAPGDRHSELPATGKNSRAATLARLGLVVLATLFWSTAGVVYHDDRAGQRHLRTGFGLLAGVVGLPDPCSWPFG